MKVYNKLRKEIKLIFAFIKIILAWALLNVFKRSLYKQNIWLICEKRDEARDNGYHFFRYMKKHHPEIETYYVISENSPDIGKVQPYGSILYANTLRHAIYYLAAEYSISSQAYGAFPYDIGLEQIKRINRLCNKKQKTVFLQHGIIKDELSHAAFDYDKCNIDYFVCGARREYSFIKEKYHYPEENIGCVGLARFDYLLRAHDEENIILIMPTWRQWLDRRNTGKTAEQRFAQSEYYQAYRNLLSSSEFLSMLQSHGMKCVLYLHYQAQSFSSVFLPLQNKYVQIADREHFDVQDLLMKSKMLITDYSSVFFDFAYLKKPEFYYQFDKAKFTESHYAEGYFSYENDGFGAVCTNQEDLLRQVKMSLENHCLMDPMYCKRVDDFFAVRDTQNCERIFADIVKLKKGRR